MDVFDKFLKSYNFAKSFGFYWADPLEIMRQINLELDEVKIELETNNRQALQDELGDVLHACFELVNFYGFDVRATAELAVDKIGKRFEVMHEMIIEDGVRDFANLSREEKLLYWEKVKQKLREPH